MIKEYWLEIPYKDLVIKISTAKQKVKQKEYIINGSIPVIDQGQNLIGGYHNEEHKILQCKLPVVIFGDHTKIIKVVNFKFIPGADGTKVLEPKSIIDPYLLANFTKILIHKISDKGYARHYQHIEKQNFPLPPLPEQRAIVAKIEQLFSELDNAIANLKKSQEQIKVYRQAVLKRAFEGKLLTNHNSSDNLSYAAEPNENYINNKNEWKEYMLKDILQLRKDKYKPDKVKSLFYVGLEHIEKDSGKLTEKVGFEEINTVKNKFYKGDLLYGKLRPYLNKAHLAKGDGVCSTDILVFKPLKTVLGELLIYYFLGKKFVNDMSENTSGVNLPRVSTSYVECHKISLPSLKEQHQIVQEIESRLSVCDKLEQTLQESLDKAEALRQSILKQAFEGKLLTTQELEGCKKEPDWEPASVLLERIKKEKKSTSHGR